MARTSRSHGPQEKMRQRRPLRPRGGRLAGGEKETAVRTANGPNCCAAHQRRERADCVEILRYPKIALKNRKMVREMCSLANSVFDGRIHRNFFCETDRILRGADFFNTIGSEPTFAACAAVQKRPKVRSADGADFQHEFSNVRFSQALNQAVARLTENQTQKLRATADAEMKVMIVPGTKFTYPGKSTNSR